jgi:hypothetical protein
MFWQNVDSNGCTGTIQGSPNDHGRYPVLQDGGGILNVKPANLQLAAPFPPKLLPPIESLVLITDATSVYWSKRAFVEQVRQGGSKLSVRFADIDPSLCKLRTVVAPAHVKEEASPPFASLEELAKLLDLYCGRLNLKSRLVNWAVLVYLPKYEDVAHGHSQPTHPQSHSPQATQGYPAALAPPALVTAEPP